MRLFYLRQTEVVSPCGAELRVRTQVVQEVAGVVRDGVCRVPSSLAAAPFEGTPAGALG